MRPRDDAGYSLLELLTTTAVMTFVTAITTTAILQIYRSVNETDAETEAQTQVTTAFRKLDKEVRYARSISDPVQLDGDYYVEYLVNLDDVDTCVELRLRPSTSELQRRQWVKNVVPVAPTSWTTLASLTTSSTPFTVTAPDQNALTGFRYQRLRVNFTATVGIGAARATRVTDITFTALNATAADNAGTCVEARGVSS